MLLPFKKTNMIPRKPREGHRETAMPKIMLFVMCYMFHTACIECLLLKLWQRLAGTMFKHLGQANPAALFVHFKHTSFTSMYTCMCANACSHSCRLTKQHPAHCTHKHDTFCFVCRHSRKHFDRKDMRTIYLTRSFVSSCKTSLSMATAMSHVPASNVATNCCQQICEQRFVLFSIPETRL